MRDNPSTELRTQPPGPARRPAAEPPTHPRISGAARGGRRGSVPASLPRSHRGAQCALRRPRDRTPASPASHPPHPGALRSERMGVLPGLLHQPWTCGAAPAAAPLPEFGRITPPLSSVPVPAPAPGTRPPHAARVCTLPVAPPTRVPSDRDPGSRKPPGQTQGRRPAEQAAPSEGLQDPVARRVFLGKPLLRPFFHSS